MRVSSVRRAATSAIILALATAPLIACGSGSPTANNNPTTGGTGSTGSSSDSLTLTLVLHGVTRTETLEEVAVGIAPGALARATATASQLIFFRNQNGPGIDETLAVRAAKGQTISLFAIEQQPWWGDNTPAPPFYHPSPTDTAVDNAAIEFASWSAPSCASAAFGDCQLLNVQSNVQVTANFQKLASVNVVVVGIGQFTRTISTRAPLTIAPVSTTNPVNGTFTTSILFDSSSAYQYEVALFSGSQLTLAATEPQNNGFTVQFDGWSGGCNAAGGPTCVIKWPASAGSNFTYPYSGTPPVPPPQARFQYYFCTQNGAFFGIEGFDESSAGAKISCTLRSP